ncbi:MAG: hypothetical protein HYR94_26770 [Chloroflexi bacterium]|nr:hypothetical protein [Chloroflexota bacterium]
MSVTELIKSVEFLVDAEGNKKAAVLDWSAWEELVTLLEKLEDQEAEDEQHWDEAFANSPDLLASLADEVLAEHRAGKTQVLDPDQL